MNTICSEENVVLYIEGELPEPGMLRMEAHFSSCQVCRRLLSEHRLIRISLNKAARVEIPRDFSAVVMAQLPSPFHTMLQPAREKILAAAASLMLVFTGLVTFVVGSQINSLAELFRIQWWNGVFIQLFSLFVDSFRIALKLVRVIATVGMFLADTLSFFLATMGRLLFHSPLPLSLASMVCAICIACGVLLIHHHHPGLLKSAGNRSR